MQGDVLYVWQVLENGGWGIIAAVPPRGPDRTVVPLVSRRLDIADDMRTVAMQHHERTGLPVRLAHFEVTTTELL